MMKELHERQQQINAERTKNRHTHRDKLKAINALIIRLIKCD